MRMRKERGFEGCMVVDLTLAVSFEMRHPEVYAERQIRLKKGEEGGIK